jgi:hypothetical protein
MRTVRNITVDPGHQHSRSFAEIIGNSFCKPVPASKLHSLHLLAPEKPAAVQDKYFSIATLKAIISKALLPFRTERVLTAVRQ